MSIIKPDKRNARRFAAFDWNDRSDPLAYPEWIALAGEYPNQEHVWRSHEYHARMRYRDEDPKYVDIGGEG